MASCLDSDSHINDYATASIADSISAAICLAPIVKCAATNHNCMQLQSRETLKKGLVKIRKYSKCPSDSNDFQSLDKMLQLHKMPLLDSGRCFYTFRENRIPSDKSILPERL